MAGRFQRAEDLSYELERMARRLARLEEHVQRVAVGADARRYASGSLSAALMTKGVQAYQTSAHFVGSSWNQVTWAGFTIRFADGSSASVDGGSLGLGNDNPYYLYWLEGSTTLQSTQVFDTVLGDDRALVALVQRPPAGANPTTQKPFVHTVKGLGEAIHSGVITANAILAIHLQAESVETDKLKAAAVTSEKITTQQIVGKDFRTATDVGEVGGPAGIRITPSEIAGYSGGTVKQFYLEAVTGKAYAGGGNIVIDAGGITFYSAPGDVARLRFFNGGDEIGDIFPGTDGSLRIVSLSLVHPLYLAALAGVAPFVPHTELGNASEPWGDVYAEGYGGPGLQKGHVTTDGGTGLATINFAPSFAAKPVLKLTPEGDRVVPFIISWNMDGGGNYTGVSIKTRTMSVATQDDPGHAHNCGGATSTVVVGSQGHTHANPATDGPNGTGTVASGTHAHGDTTDSNPDTPHHHGVVTGPSSTFDVADHTHTHDQGPTDAPVGTETVAASGHGHLVDGGVHDHDIANPVVAATVHWTAHAS